jgi:hypothetical protein
MPFKGHDTQGIRKNKNNRFQLSLFSCFRNKNLPENDNEDAVAHTRTTRQRSSSLQRLGNEPVAGAGAGAGARQWASQPVSSGNNIFNGVNKPALPSSIWEEDAAEEKNADLRTRSASPEEEDDKGKYYSIHTNLQPAGKGILVVSQAQNQNDHGNQVAGENGGNANDMQKKQQGSRVTWEHPSPPPGATSSGGQHAGSENGAKHSDAAQQQQNNNIQGIGGDGAQQKDSSGAKLDDTPRSLDIDPRTLQQEESDTQRSGAADAQANNDTTKGGNTIVYMSMVNPSTQISGVSMNAAAQEIGGLQDDCLRTSSKDSSSSHNALDADNAQKKNNNSSAPPGNNSSFKPGQVGYAVSQLPGATFDGSAACVQNGNLAPQNPNAGDVAASMLSAPAVDGVPAQKTSAENQGGSAVPPPQTAGVAATAGDLQQQVKANSGDGAVRAKGDDNNGGKAGPNGYLVWKVLGDDNQSQTQTQTQTQTQGNNGGSDGGSLPGNGAANRDTVDVQAHHDNLIQAYTDEFYHVGLGTSASAGAAQHPEETHQGGQKHEGSGGMEAGGNSNSTIAGHVAATSNNGDAGAGANGSGTMPATRDQKTSSPSRSVTVIIHTDVHATPGKGAATTTTPSSTPQKSIMKKDSATGDARDNRSHNTSPTHNFLHSHSGSLEPQAAPREKKVRIKESAPPPPTLLRSPKSQPASPMRAPPTSMWNSGAYLQGALHLQALPASLQVERMPGDPSKMMPHPMVQPMSGGGGGMPLTQMIHISSEASDSSYIAVLANQPTYPHSHHAQHQLYSSSSRSSPGPALELSMHNSVHMSDGPLSTNSRTSRGMMMGPLMQMTNGQSIFAPNHGPNMFSSNNGRTVPSSPNNNNSNTQNMFSPSSSNTGQNIFASNNGQNIFSPSSPASANFTPRLAFSTPRTPTIITPRHTVGPIGMDPGSVGMSLTMIGATVTPRSGMSSARSLAYFAPGVNGGFVEGDARAAYSPMASARSRAYSPAESARAVAF